MMRKSNLRLCGILLIVVLTAGCLTGCGRKQVEYGGDIASDTDSVGADDIYSLKDTLAVEDSWEETIEINRDNINNIVIDAEVTVPDTYGLKVVSSEKKVIDENYKKELAESLSDGTVYLYDDAHKLKAEWQKEINYIEQAIIAEQQSNVEQEIIDRDYEMLAHYQEMYEQAPESYAAAEDYSEDIYKLDRNGKEYLLSFNRMEETGYIGISFYPLEYKQFLEAEEAENYKHIDLHQNNLPYGSVVNKCQLTQENAEKETMEFLDYIGAVNFRQTGAYDLMWMTDTGSVWYDGCAFTMYRCIDGVNIDGCDYNSVNDFFITDAGEQVTWDNYNLEQITIMMNDDGILGFQWAYPLELGKTEVDNVTILPYENIKESLRQALQEHCVNYSTTRTVKYNKLELLYYRCKESDESDNYSIVPVWRLSNIESGEIQRCIMVNAIDGSYIDIESDLFR